MKKNLKKFILSILSLVPIRFIPLDLFLWLSQRITSAIAYLLFIRDWQLEANGRPQFFKHRINLARWPFEPSRWAFVARGVYSRENMFRGCKVLDLCCGDGSYSYLFYSDIASHIDAVDNDSIAIKYARKYHSNSKIIFHQIDIVNHDLPSSEYDIVVWNAAICYFELHEIKQIILKIIKSGKPNMQLIGMIPKANGWVDHKTEFSDAEILRQLFLQYFKVVTIKEVDEVSITTFYFQASSPY
jgi:SAM-dependent methyltransferase